MIEVELKCSITPESRPLLEKKLQEARFQQQVYNSDVYYDTVTWDLLQRAVFVRVRNQRQLEFKFNEQAEKAHVQSTERAFSLTPNSQQAQAMNELFAHFLPAWHTAPTFIEAVNANNLLELARIENTRKQYTYDTLQICVDHVTGLGDFLEVETLCAEGTDTTQALQRLHDFVADFSFEPLTVGYVELWLRLYNPEAYRRGVYQLPDDARSRH